MGQTLEEILLDPARRPVVISDLQELVDQEVSAKSGVSGAVIKAGYATVKKLKPGAIPHAVNQLLGDFAGALEPYYSDYRSAAGSDFGHYLSSRPEAAEALLCVTDARAEETPSEAMRKAYTKLRPHGRRNVEEALPRLGALIDKHSANA